MNKYNGRNEFTVIDINCHRNFFQEQQKNFQEPYCKLHRRKHCLDVNDKLHDNNKPYIAQGYLDI